MFYEQVEAVFCSADEEESDLPLHVRNKLVRVLPNMSGYKCCYVDENRLKKVDMPEDPLFNCEQEKLLHELTTLMSEPVEMKQVASKQKQEEGFSLPRNKLIQAIWQEQCQLPLFDNVVIASKAQSLNEQVDEYIQKQFEA